MPRGARPPRGHGEDVDLDLENKGMLLKDKSDVRGFMGLQGHSGYSVGPRRQQSLIGKLWGKKTQFSFLCLGGALDSDPRLIP